MAKDPCEVSTRPLLDKLGVKPGSRVGLVGGLPEAFRAELAERTDVPADGVLELDLDLIFLQVAQPPDLEQFGPVQRYLKRNGAIWLIRPKGKNLVTERMGMEAGKAAGLVDVKVVRFSDTHTAEKFVIPLNRR